MSNETIDFDPNSLTLEELCEFEEATGEVAYDVFGGEGKMTAKALIGIVWLVKRRTNPEYTYDEARSLRIGDVIKTVGG